MTKQIQIFILCLTFTYGLGTLSPPVITKHPSSDILFKLANSLEQENPFLIECEAEGEPQPSYTWIKNDQIFEWQKHSDRIARPEGKGTLLIRKPTEHDAGSYKCIAENVYGKTESDYGTVRKAILNDFKGETPKLIKAIEGQPFQLGCEPPFAYPPPQIHWVIQNIDTSINIINDPRLTVDPNGNLWFSNVTFGDATNNSFYYTCIAVHRLLDVYRLGNRVLLQVKESRNRFEENKVEPVRQFSSKEITTAVRGKEIELFCIYGGTPLPDITWTKNDDEINWSNRVTIQNRGKSIVIINVKFADAGEYKCTANNGVGKMDYYSIYLEVKSPPYFIREPKKQILVERQDAEFYCEVGGFPTPVVRWYFNAVFIDNAESNIRKEVTSNKIIIRNVTLSDTGSYVCKAENNLGRIYKGVYLKVIEA